MKLFFSCIFIFLLTTINCLPLPPKRRVDYPLDQDCHVCHAVIIESMKRIGNVVSPENIKRVLHSICDKSSFEGYALQPDELRPLCFKFVDENEDRLQLNIFRKHMNQYRESVDDFYCNTSSFCPNGWNRIIPKHQDYMEDEL